jgi:hypothetical protein
MQIFAWIMVIGYFVWAINEYARDAWGDGGMAERSWRDEIRKTFLAVPGGIGKNGQW